VKGSPAHFVEALALLFNIYMRQRRWEWILSVTDSVPQKFQQEALILRNRARALSKLNRIKEAESEYRRLLDLYPNDDQVHLWYSGFLEEQGRFAEAYEFTEKAILADPDDPRLYLSLAIDIFNHGYYRTSSGEIKGPMPRKLRGRVATPLVLRAVEVGRRTKQILEEAVRVLVRGEALEAADAVSRGEIPSGEYNLEALQWVEQQLIEKRSKATSASD
jgi:tetratricopeptide (TPR) repeat protein